MSPCAKSDVQPTQISALRPNTTIAGNVFTNSLVLHKGEQWSHYLFLDFLSMTYLKENVKEKRNVCTYRKNLTLLM